MDLKPGSIVVFSSKGHAFFTLAQKLFTHEWLPGSSPKKFKQGDKTHSLIIWFQEAGEDAVFEAYLCSTIDPWSQHTSNTKYWIFEPTGFTDEEIKNALYYIYKRTAGTPYAFLETPWFVYRYFAEIFHKDVRKQGNWFPGGNICSQNVYYYLYFMSANKPELRAFLDEWNSAGFHSSDTFTVLSKFSNLFTLKATQL